MIRTPEEQEADERLEQAYKCLQECIKDLGMVVVYHHDVYNTATRSRQRQALERLLSAREALGQV